MEKPAGTVKTIYYCTEDFPGPGAATTESALEEQSGKSALESIPAKVSKGLAGQGTRRFRALGRSREHVCMRVSRELLAVADRQRFW